MIYRNNVCLRDAYSMINVLKMMTDGAQNYTFIALKLTPFVFSLQHFSKCLVVYKLLNILN